MATATAPRQLSQKEADIQMMLAAEVHLGTKNCDFQMERYVFKRRNDGTFLILLLTFRSSHLIFILLSTFSTFAVFFHALELSVLMCTRCCSLLAFSQ